VIVYVPDPFSIWDTDKKQESSIVKLPSGGHIIVEPYGQNKVKVLSINSTDPMDYLNQTIQPGEILELGVKI